MWARHRPAWSTTAAAALMGTVSLVYAAYAVLALLDARDAGPIASRDAVLLGISGREAGVATPIIAIIILVVTALTSTLTVGVLRRGEGARHAALMTFGVLGALALAASLPGLQSVPPRAGAPFGVLTGIVDLVVVGLLLLRSTADDVEDAERFRERLRTRG